MATKAEVLAAITDGQTCLINALGPEQHEGQEPSGYARPGRIASSVNVPASALVKNPATHAYLPLDQLPAMVANVGATEGGRVITYCGAGIAASSDALILHHAWRPAGGRLRWQSLRVGRRPGTSDGIRSGLISQRRLLDRRVRHATTTDDATLPRVEPPTEGR